DSLTEGYVNFCTDFHSYSINLQKRFKQAGIEVVVKEEGVSGDRVLSKNMEKRLRKFLKEVSNKNQRVDWVIIMGGTNDLFTSSAESIFEALKGLYDICEEYNTKVLAMSIIESRAALSSPKNNDKRAKINEFIKDYAKTNENVTFYDLAKDLPYEDNLDWNLDGLHLTTSGYDRMGDLIFESLYKEIKPN
ncbi:11396_t:CDS:2, partial [Cetraspora pellucida]